jgi:hypothetical protein
MLKATCVVTRRASKILVMSRTPITAIHVPAVMALESVRMICFLGYLMMPRGLEGVLKRHVFFSKIPLRRLGLVC